MKFKNLTEEETEEMIEIMAGGSIVSLGLAEKALTYGPGNDQLVESITELVNRLQVLLEKTEGDIPVPDCETS